MLFESSLSGNPAGTGTFIRGLQAELSARPEIELIPASFRPRSAHALDTGAKGLARRGGNTIDHLRYYAWSLPRQAQRLGCDLVFCPSSLVPLRGPVPLVMTVFDLTPLDRGATQDWISRQYIAGMMRVGMRRAAGIVTISEAVASEIAGRLRGSRRQPITVAYPGPNPDLERADPRRPSIPECPFVLMVGTVEPRKNHLTALHALASHLHRRPASKLVLVAAGSAGWRYGPVRQAVKDLELADRVIWLGAVDNSELKWLYQNALGLLFPSLYEGFGLPVLEAMRLNCPVVAAAIPAVIEVTAGTSTLIDPLDVEAWTDALGSLENSKRQTEPARQRAASFSWSACGDSTLAAIEAALSRKR